MTASIREMSDNAHDAARVATEAVEVAETTSKTIAKLDVARLNVFRAIAVALINL